MYTEYHNSCSSGSGRNPRPVSGKAIAALILGILSVLFSSVFFIGILLACIGIVCALSSRQIYISGDTLQKRRTPMDITAKIGFIFSVVGIVLGILVPLILGVFTYQAFNTSDFFQEEVPYIEEIPDIEEIRIPNLTRLFRMKKFLKKNHTICRTISPTTSHMNPPTDMMLLIILIFHMAMKSLLPANMKIPGCSNYKPFIIKRTFAAPSPHRGTKL